jgi:hypothetical protein
VAQLEVLAELGVKRCVSIGTAGGFQADQEPGDVVLLASAVRDEGTSYHYLPADVPAVPDPALTTRFGAALAAAGLSHTTGPTVTTDAPYRTTAEEIGLHRTAGTRAVEMEAAGLFAPRPCPESPDRLGSRDRRRTRPDRPGLPARRRPHPRVLRGLFSATIDFLTSEP